ncbi:hypothetical protein CCR94_07780 [Rhodoblastus sphagnicola]|uniref:Uncharacterized protein n=1 Tax=Rhodoblastus sphagnicola TaxID=333368 RepID=A0A2S6NB87_9HYPH|nr:hypothetical protein CCR94_07780 [Rhodoblastus sphagnicola]
MLAAGTPLAFLVAGGLPALAQGYAKDSSLPGFDSLIALLGYDNLQGDQRDLLAFVLILFGLGFGYFSHLGFRGAGLGVMLNGLCGLVGSCLALYLLGPKYGLLSQVQGRTHDFLLAVLVGGAAVPALILAIMLANLRSRATVNFFYWRSQRKLNVQRAALIEPELPPRIANLLKK